MGIEVELSVFIVDALFLVDDILVQAGGHIRSGAGVYPVDRTLDLAAGESAATLCLGIIGHVYGCDIAVFILVKAHTLDEIGIHQAHFVSGEETVILSGRNLHKVVALDPELASEGNLPFAQPGVFEVVIRFQHFDLSLGIIVDNQLERVQDCQHALAAGLEILADAVLQSREIGRGIALGNAAHVDKALDGGRCVASAAQAGDRDQTGIVPSVDDVLLDQLLDIALAGDLVGQVHLGKLDLSGRMRIFGLFDDPVVKGTVVLEFKRAERVGDALDGVLNGVGEIIHGINAPCVACIVVGHVSDTVDDRVAHIDIGAGHIDFSTEGLLSVSEFACPHFFEQVEILLDAAVAVGIIFAGLRQGAAVLAHLLRREVGDIGLALFDQLDRHIIHFLEIIGGKEQPVLIIGAQPVNIGLDGLHKLDLFLGGVGVIETKIEFAAVFLRHTIVQKYALGVADMKVTVGLGGKTCMYTVIDAVPEVLVDFLFYKMSAYSLFFRCGGRDLRCLFTHAGFCLLHYYYARLYTHLYTRLYTLFYKFLILGFLFYFIVRFIIRARHGAADPVR